MASNTSTVRTELSGEAVDAISFLLSWRRNATAEFSAQIDRVLDHVRRAGPRDSYQSIVELIERGR